MAMNKTDKTLRELGLETCLKAYAMSRQGEGANTVAQYLGFVDASGRINTRKADRAIDAGRAIFDAGRAISQNPEGWRTVDTSTGPGPVAPYSPYTRYSRMRSGEEMARERFLDRE